jgi:predicted membrane channel-forming protein YqfA (hemolysin III family)
LSEWRVDALVHVVGVILGIAACLTLAIVASPSADSAVLVSLSVYGAG